MKWLCRTAFFLVGVAAVVLLMLAIVGIVLANEALAAWLNMKPEVLFGMIASGAMIGGIACLFGLIGVNYARSKGWCE